MNKLKELELKKCTKCLEVKSFSDFYFRSDSDKRIPVSHCKKCVNEKNEKHYKQNKKYYTQKRQECHLRNKDKEKELNKKYHQKNPLARREAVKKFVKNNPELYVYYANLRRTKKVSATPLWANQFLIKKIYELSKIETKNTGVKHHVDHIVPINHSLVCGLHCEFNLRVIPAFDNLSKSNNFEVC